MISEMFGNLITSLMAEILEAEDTLPEGFAVGDASVEFNFNELAGRLQGQWKITVERISEHDPL